LPPGSTLGKFERCLTTRSVRRSSVSAFSVYLYREDLLAQAVSTHFTTLTGRRDVGAAVTTVAAAQPDCFAAAALDRTIEGLAEEDRRRRVFLARNGVSGMSASYEQLRRAPLGFVAAVAHRFGVIPVRFRQGYSETHSRSESDPALPSRSEVARRSVASRHNFYGVIPGQPRAPGDPAPAGRQEAGQ
jgi:LPS sulfotransferase NodH